MSTQHRRNLNVETRILSEKDGLVEYVASDATLDSYQESILASGWKFDFMNLNSPFVDSHNYYSIEAMLGKVTGWRVNGDELVEQVKWAKDIAEHKLAMIGWKLTLGGFLKAVSVGFRALKAVVPSDSAWSQFVTAARLKPEDAAKCRRIFVEQQQLELSACVLGANPSAVARAYSEGCVRDEDLAAVGFADEDLHFLSVAGPAMERPETDAAMRLLVEREMKRITSRKFSPTGKTPSHSPSTPDGGEQAMRQAEERAVFIKQFESLLS